MSSDLALEQKFHQDPQGTFRVVYERYSGPLFRFLFRFTGNNQGSEEILQDIFLELLKGKYRPQEGGSLKSWLFTLARNRGLNHVKKNSRLVESDLSEFSGTTNLEEHSIALNLLQHLSKSEAVLPKDIQETWNLRKQGFDNQQIAHKLSIPLGTVKSRFSRLVDYLRREFEHES